MPSIRIKDQAYSNLEDGPEGDYDTPQPDSQISAQYTPSPFLRVTPRIPSRLSLPFLRAEPPNVQHSTSTPITPRRPRAATTASRVHIHCTSNIRSPNFFNPIEDISTTGPATELATPSLSPARYASHAYPRAGQTMTIEGLQTELRMASQGEPGLIENSINSHTDGGDDADADHHHDDVVDHLDVIGTLLILPFKFNL
jgi:hypothetical protein